MLMQRTASRGYWATKRSSTMQHHIRLASPQASRGCTGTKVLLETLAVSAPAQAQPATLAFLQQSLHSYVIKTPAVKSTVAALTATLISTQSLKHDHFAYRTLGVPGLGINSLAQVLFELGYSREEEGLQFPAKKLTAAWFSFKQGSQDLSLPRVFVSEIKVDQLSPEAQSIIKQRVAGLSLGSAAVTTACLTGTLPWPRPSLEEYNTLLKESDYAAWVMAHGYQLNHTALSVHNMRTTGTGSHPLVSIKDAAGWMAAAGLPMNLDGGLIKVSPDGLLQQCSTLSDMVGIELSSANGPTTVELPGSYLELVERLPLPQFAHLNAAQIKEAQRREGFEVSNASHLFTSTRKL